MASTRLPALFVGHGSPMNAIEDNEFSRAWQAIGRELLRPRAVLCVSAHWETEGVRITAMPRPRTIHDFHGFPPALHAAQYPAPGDPELARRVCELIEEPSIALDQDWGLDHGAWSVLCRMFPRADVPVVQLSLHRTRDLRFHYDLGERLALLREDGVLLMGSGNIVHNLSLMVWEDRAFDWALEFDARVKAWILDGDHEPILRPEEQGRAAALAVNSAEHYLPLLYVLGAKRPGEPVRFFNEKIWGGSISMRGVLLG